MKTYWTAATSTSVVEHDFDTSVLDGESGKGAFFEADPLLINTAKSVAEEMKITYHAGLIASGDQFISRNEQVSKILHDFRKAFVLKWKLEELPTVPPITGFLLSSFVH